MGRGIAVVVALLLALTGCAAKVVPPPAPDLAAAVEQKLSSGGAGLANVRSVLVFVDGKPRLEHYREGWTADSTSHVWSVTKSVVGLLTAMAVQDDLLSYDSRLEDLLPDHRPAMTGWQRKLTLRQLMTMSAGMDDARTDYTNIASLIRQRADLANRMLRDNRAGEPGTWVYSNTSAHLVAVALDAALRRNDDDLWSFARRRLFDPLGIDMSRAWREPLTDTVADDFLAADRAWGVDPQGIPVGAFGLRLTAPDLLKIGQLALDGGRWQRRTLVASAPLAEQWEPSATADDYGMLWWLNAAEEDHRLVLAAGTDGHLIVLSPEQHAVIVVTSQNDQKYQMGDDELIPLIGDVIIPALDR